MKQDAPRVGRQLLELIAWIEPPPERTVIFMTSEASRQKIENVNFYKGHMMRLHQKYDALFVPE